LDVYSAKLVGMTLRAHSLQTLKRLAKQVPDEKEAHSLLSELEEVGDHAADRAIALIGGAMIENALRAALLSRLFHQADNIQNEIFENDGAPLSTFSQRIIVGYAMGIYGNKIRNDLDCIRIIRNSFAHTMLTLSFDRKEVVNVCKRFNTLRRLTIAHGVGQDARRDYILVVSHLTGAIRRNVLEQRGFAFLGRTKFDRALW
jgi:hypothetical protein